MYSELKSISFMGVSDPEMFLSEKDLNAMEFNFLVGPTLEEIHHDDCQISRNSEKEKGDEDEVSKAVQQLQKPKKAQEGDQGEDKFGLLVSTLKLKIPTHGGVEEFRLIDQDHRHHQDKEDDHDDVDNNGFKTPTSLDQKIPATLKCPPAPRKPKSLPSTKRKAHHHQRVLLDLSSEIESLFPPALFADLGGKVKKKKSCTTK